MELRTERGDATLAASYSPAGTTAIVALHAAGEGTREGLLYRHLHEVLPPAGIGVVTFDRRGEGESTGDASRGRFDVQAKDALDGRDAVGTDDVRDGATVDARRLRRCGRRASARAATCVRGLGARRRARTG